MFDAIDAAEESLAGGGGAKGADGGGLMGHFLQAFGQGSDFLPGVARVIEDQHFRELAEDEAAFVVDPSAQAAERESGIDGQGLAMVQGVA